MGWVLEPCSEQVRVDNADPHKLFTAIRRATHEAGIPECEFISGRCIKWPEEWGDHPWSAVARGVDLADLTRRSDEDIARSKRELVELDRRRHDDCNRHYRRCAGTGVSRCSDCNWSFNIPFIKGRYLHTPYDRERDNAIYFSHFPFHYLWADMAVDDGNQYGAPGFDFTIKIEHYVAGSGSMTFSVRRINEHRSYWDDWVGTYQEICRNFATYLDQRGGDSELPVGDQMGAGRAESWDDGRESESGSGRASDGEEGSTEIVEVEDVEGQRPLKRHRGPDDDGHDSADSPDLTTTQDQQQQQATEVFHSHVMLAFEYDFYKVRVVDADRVLVQELSSPPYDSWDFLERLQELGDNEIIPGDNTCIDCLAHLRHRSIRAYAEKIGYPLDYLRLLYPSEFADFMEERGEARNVIQTIERAMWTALFDPDYAICRKRMRAKAAEHGMKP